MVIVFVPSPLVILASKVVNLPQKLGGKGGVGAKPKGPAVRFSDQALLRCGSCTRGALRMRSSETVRAG